MERPMMSSLARLACAVTARRPRSRARSPGQRRCVSGSIPGIPALYTRRRSPGVRDNALLEARRHVLAGVHRHRAGGLRAAAGAAPAEEDVLLRGGLGGQRHAAAGGEAGAAGGAAADAARLAADAAGATAGD